MTQQHRTSFVVLGLVAVALVGALVVTACQDTTRPVATAPAHVRSDVNCGGSGSCPPPEQCITGKWTGGGRIDPPSNPDQADAATGVPDALPPGLPPMSGKVTFGFNVFLGSDPGGQCIVTKGEIEVNGHEIEVSGQPPAFKIAWHVSIHDGVDAFGTHVFAETFAPDASGRGVCLVVGLPSTNYMMARANPGQGSELVQFEVCDNDRGRPQNSRTDAMRWRTQNHGDTGLTYLTGGNIVDHGS